jgi:hypothetical protein
VQAGAQQRQAAALREEVELARAQAGDRAAQLASGQQEAARLRAALLDAELDTQRTAAAGDALQRRLQEALAAAEQLKAQHAQVRRWRWLWGPAGARACCVGRWRAGRWHRPPRVPRELVPACRLQVAADSEAQRSRAAAAEQQAAQLQDRLAQLQEQANTLESALESAQKLADNVGGPPDVPLPAAAPAAVTRLACDAAALQLPPPPPAICT